MNITVKAPSQDAAPSKGTGSRQARRFSHVVSVSGSQAVAALDALHEGSEGKRIEIGSLVKIPTPHSSVVGIVSAVSAPMPADPNEDRDIRLVEVGLAGEI